MDNNERYELSPPQPLLDEEDEQPRPSGWSWIGSPDRPEAKESKDGISDLFKVTPKDVGADVEDLNDLTEVDIEEDVIDADEDGTLDSMTDVSTEDIMGEADGADESVRRFNQKAPLRVSRVRPARVSRYVPPTSMRGWR